MLGKLTWEAVPLHEPIVVVTLAAMVLGGLALLGAVTYFKASVLNRMVVFIISAPERGS